MGIVDDLLEHPGLYLGVVHDMDNGNEDAARMFVDPLPGRAGVALDYQTFNPANSDNVRGHYEQAMLVRVYVGQSILVTAHSHATSAAILRETDPGVFELGDEGSPFPMKITIECQRRASSSTAGGTARPAVTSNNTTERNFDSSTRES